MEDTLNETVHNIQSKLTLGLSLHFLARKSNALGVMVVAIIEFG